MSKAKLIGMNKPYVPNSKADMRKAGMMQRKNAYERNRKGAPPAGSALNRQERRRLAREKAGA